MKHTFKEAAGRYVTASLMHQKKIQVFSALFAACSLAVFSYYAYGAVSTAFVAFGFLTLVTWSYVTIGTFIGGVIATIWETFRR